MDKKFLHKVVDQIVSETKIDYDEGRLYTPFSPSFSSVLLSSLSPFSSVFPFIKHCRDVYGLNEEESEYVWNEWREIIKDKIDE
jgi:hypothetical protein